MNRAGRIKGFLALLLVLAVATGLLMYGLGQTALSDRDEGEYAASVAAMRASGDYLVPTLNGRNYLEKPILTFWAMAASFKLLGPGETAARLPSALSGFLLLMALGLLVWRVSGQPGLGALAVACLGFSPLFVLVGRACLTDMLLSLWTTLALLCFFMATETEAPRDRGWYLAAWVALGLGFLTKGPVAPAVVLPTALIYVIWQRRLGHTLKRAQILWGLLIFLLINLPWYGLIWYRLGDEFWQAFFVSQNLRRFTEALLGHGGGLVYYLPVILLGAYPFAGAALPELGRSLFQNPRAQRQSDPLARLHLFSGLALVLVFLVFSLAATKQINYLLPALPFLAILAGCSLDRLARGDLGGRLARLVFWGGLLGLGAILALALAAVPLGLPLFWDQILASIRFDSSEYAMPMAAPVMVLWPLLAAATLTLMVLAAGRFYRRGRDGWVPWALGAGTAVFCGLVFLGLLPQASDYIQQPAKEMGMAVRQRAGQDEKVITYGLWKPSLIFYTGRDLPRLKVEQGGELAKELASGQPLIVMSRVRLLDQLSKLPGFVEMGRYGGYLLGGNQAASLIGSGQAQPQAVPPPKEVPKTLAQPQTPKQPEAMPELPTATPPQTSGAEPVKLPQPPQARPGS